MPGFGTQVDYFGLDSATLSFVESSTTPMAVSVENAQDQDGNIAGQGDFEAGPADAIEATYRLIGGTLNLNTLQLGPKTVDAVETLITQIAVNTSNGEWPTLVISGFTGITNKDNMPNFALPSITISGKKQAQGLDFTVGADCRLTSSSLTASGEVAHVLDNAGIVGAMAFSGATIEIGGEAVEIEGIVAWTPGGTWTETQAPGASGGNVSWGTASFAATKYLEAVEES
jgi:hypothetical protein